MFVSFSKLGNRCFWVSVRHVGAHPGEHQHGVSIQISISLGETFLRISRNLVNEIFLWTESWRGSLYINLLLFPDSGLYLLNGFDFDFDFDLFWMAWHWKPAIKKLLQQFPVHGNFKGKSRTTRHITTLYQNNFWISHSFLLFSRAIDVISSL